MKTSQILREAKKLLVAPKGGAGTPFVCWAITRVVIEKPRTRNKANQLKKRIMRSLNGHGTASQWLRINQGIANMLLTTRNMQTYRHLWVDHMIAEHEAAGD